MPSTLVKPQKTAALAELIRNSIKAAVEEKATLWASNMS
jgi:hypothetical protein